MRRWALAPLSLAVAFAIRSTTPILIAQASPAAPAIELPGASAALRGRMDAAAQLATLRYTEWLGPPPFERVTVRDARSVDSPGQMRVESLVAQQVARAWFARIDGYDQWKDGAAIYLQSRLVEELFDRTYLLKAYRYDGACFFGCFAPWSFRELPLSRWTAVTDRGALAFASLERELGWPVLQGAMRVAASGSGDPVVAMSDAAGRDLAPVFDAASRGVLIDRTITSLSSEPASCAAPCYRTLVSIGPAGPAPLPLIVRVSFADGQSIETRWDGSRDRLEFESAAPAIGAHLDPDRMWLLDRNPLNNARVPPRETNVPVVKWMARWIVWLQDAVLTHTFPV